MLIAIDPGSEQSAFVVWNGETILQHGKEPNEHLLVRLTLEWSSAPLYVEMIASYGMAVGAEVFETCVWIGRFLQAYGSGEKVYRREVKLHHCESVKAKDSNVRQAIIDRFGDKGTKKAQGVTYGLKADEWQAFALAIYAYDTRKVEALL